ncbi:MAG: hypothetical protein ABI947_11455 [Chloroflexota bacterium]
MDRKVPRTGSEEIDLYIRTYYSLLRSSNAIQLDALVETHKAMESILHSDAEEVMPDVSAFTYASLRLPACIVDVKLVVLGQNSEGFKQHGYPTITDWKRVTTPGRRRYTVYDGESTLAAYIASRSDIDDLIPILTTYQIEWNKLHLLLQPSQARSALDWLSQQPQPFADSTLELLGQATSISSETLIRLQATWGGAFLPTLQAIAAHPKRFLLRLLAGSLVNYQKATSDWWRRIAHGASPIELDEHPIYFVSSNLHAMTNLLTGFAVRESDNLMAFVESGAAPDLLNEHHLLEEADNDQNFVYYALRRYLHAGLHDAAARKTADERTIGIAHISPKEGFDIAAQIIELNHLQPDWLDARLIDGIDVNALKQSNALIVNIDYPLGMAAYQVLSKVGEKAMKINGVYFMGKAASLNGRIGDVMLPNVVYDEHSQNTYLFGNCFQAPDIAPCLKMGSVLDNQKAVTVRGTFLQNSRYMDVFYREGYTIIEMEAGPYLSAVYEMVRPQRHPVDEIVNLYPVPFDIGFIHYASDTPLSKGKTLGAGSLSYIGAEPTYAAAIAILRRIFQQETIRLRQPESMLT